MTIIHPMTRSRALTRARFGWEHGTVPFNKMAFHPETGYRTDGPGFISMVYDIPLFAPKSMNGMSVITLLTEGYFREIPREKIQPGDVLGELGTTQDPDGGVAVIFEQWLNDDPKLGYAVCIEHLAITSPGPGRRARALDYRWHAYEYTNLVERPLDLPVLGRPDPVLIAGEVSEQGTGATGVHEVGNLVEDVPDLGLSTKGRPKLDDVA